MRLSDSLSIPECYDRDPRWDGLPWCCVALGLILWSFLRVPIPAVNEPHYFAKAKHFWDPQWCAGDLFLESSNPHLVFYVTFGWLTRVLSLEPTVVISRIVSLLIVAQGWQRLASTVSGNRWGGVAALPLFLLLQSLGNWSGEWLVGGCESKVPAYGFLFWGLACLFEGRLRAAAILVGLAVSFHPIVGLWGTIALGLAILWTGWPDSGIPGVPVAWRQLAIAAMLFLATATPGLWGAAGTLGGVSAEDELAATHLQVAYRLAHHLDPLSFSKESYREYALLLAIWFLLARELPQSGRRRWWTVFVLMSIGIALVGVAIAWGPRPVKTMPGWEWRIRLLKFYPFRLADLLVPMAVSLAGAQSLLIALARVPSSKRRYLAVVGSLVLCWCGALWIPGSDQNPSRMPDDRRRAWQEVGQWLHRNAEPTALIQGIDEEWGIKWYAGRPEYVNYKDCPQDAASLLEWNRRRWVLSEWKKSAIADGFISAEELVHLRRSTGIDYLLAFRFGPVRTTPEMESPPFRIYRLRDANDETSHQPDLIRIE